MSTTTTQQKRVLYECGCGRYGALHNMYYCVCCARVLCSELECTTCEIASYYDPFTFITIGAETAKNAKYRVLDYVTCKSCGHANNKNLVSSCTYCKTSFSTVSSSGSSSIRKHFEALRLGLSAKPPLSKSKTTTKARLRRPKQTWSDLTSLPISQSSRWSIEKLESKRLERDMRVSNPILPTTTSSTTTPTPTQQQQQQHPSLRVKYIKRCRTCVQNGRSGLVLKPEIEALAGDSTSTRTGVYSEKETFAYSYIPMVRLVPGESTDDFIEIVLKNPCVYDSSPILGDVQVRLSKIQHQRVPVEIDDQIELPKDTLTIGSGTSTSTTATVTTRSRKNSSTEMSTRSSSSSSLLRVKLTNRDKSKNAIAFKLTSESIVPEVIYKGKTMKVSVNILLLL